MNINQYQECKRKNAPSSTISQGNQHFSQSKNERRFSYGYSDNTRVRKNSSNFTKNNISNRELHKNNIYSIPDTEKRQKTWVARREKQIMQTSNRRNNRTCC